MLRILPVFILAAVGSLVAPSIATAEDYVVVVHKDNKVTDYKKAELTKIFKREVKRWANNDKIVVLLPKKKTAEMDLLLDKVYSMSEKDLGKHWVTMIYQNNITKRPKRFPAGLVTLKVLSGNKGGISIATQAQASKMKGVKALTIDGLKPGEKGYLLSDKAKAMAMISSLNDAEMVETAAQEASAPKMDQDGGDTDRISDLEDQLLDMQVEMATGGDSSDTSDGPLISIKGFGHVNFGGQTTDFGTSDSENQFALGGMDLFISSKLGENVSFLNETVFEPTEDGGYVLDVERVIFKYDVSDALNIQVGRFHTTMGDWNTRYHHGEYLQAAIGRPGVYAFEDENGILPVHLVGIVLKGRHDTESMGIDYTVELGNGRGATPDPPQITVDANSNKAVNLAFGISPNSVEGLRLGGGTYFDRIAANADASAGSVHGAMDEFIWSVFAAYSSGDWEAVVEFLEINHEEDGGAGSTDSNGWYVQIARAHGAWKPYVRYDSTELDDADNFFASTDDVDTMSLGVRYDFAPWSAIKFQYDNRDITVNGGPDGTEDALTVQVSFAF